MSAPVVSRYREWSRAERLKREIGERVRALREHNGWTQKRLDIEMGMLHNGGNYSNQIENGKRLPGMMTLHRLAKAFGVTMSELLQGIE